MESLYNAKLAEIDIERAKIAGTLIRVQFQVEHEAVEAYIKEEIKNSLSLPYGFAVTYGEPAGPAEAAATFMNIYVQTAYLVQPYHYVQKGDRNLMLPTPKNSMRDPELHLLYGVKIRLFTDTERKRLKSKNISSNWEHFDGKVVKVPIPPEIILPTGAKALERQIKLPKVYEDYEERLLRTLTTDYNLPPLTLNTNHFQAAF